MAKIENPTSVIDIEAIAKIVDVVMVARGDLAVEARLCRVSLLQQEILAVCKRVGRETLVATQFLDSLSLADEPSYADVNDIYMSVRAGYNGIMLTGEIAASKNPLIAFEVLKKAVYSQ